MRISRRATRLLGKKRVLSAASYPPFANVAKDGGTHIILASALKADHPPNKNAALRRSPSQKRAATRCVWKVE